MDLIPAEVSRSLVIGQGPVPGISTQLAILNDEVAVPGLLGGQQLGSEEAQCTEVPRTSLISGLAKESEVFKFIEEFRALENKIQQTLIFPLRLFFSFLLPEFT